MRVKNFLSFSFLQISITKIPFLCFFPFGCSGKSGVWGPSRSLSCACILFPSIDLLFRNCIYTTNTPARTLTHFMYFSLHLMDSLLQKSCGDDDDKRNDLTTNLFLSNLLNALPKITDTLQSRRWVNLMFN